MWSRQKCKYNVQQFAAGRQLLDLIFRIVEKLFGQK